MISLGLSGSLPLEQIFAGHGHAPEGSADCGDACPRLKGQQPQPQKSLHYGAAQSVHHGGVIAPPGVPRFLGRQLRKGDEKSGGQRQKGGGRGGGQAAGFYEEASEDRRECQRSHKGAAEGVEQLPSVDVRKRSAPGKYPGQVLPVAAGPAVHASEIPQRPGGKSVGELAVAHISAAKERALQRVVGQHCVIRKISAALQKGVGVDNALSRKAAAAEKIHIKLAAQTSVGIGAALPGEYPGKIGAGRAFKLRGDAGVDDAVSGDHHASFPVCHRAVERVQHRPDKLSGRAGQQLGVAVQREYISCAVQRLWVSGQYLQTSAPAENILRQRQHGAALALVTPVNAVGLAQHAPAAKKVKSAAVLFVQSLNALPGGGQNVAVLRQLFAFALPEVGQDTEGQVAPALAVQKPEPLQFFRQLFPGIGGGQQGGHHAYGPPLVWHALLQRQARNAPGLQKPHYYEIQQTFHQLGYRQKQQERGGGAFQGKAGQKSKEKRQEQICGYIPRAGAPLWSVSGRADIQPVSHVPLPAPGALRKLENFFGKLILLHAPGPGKLCYRIAVIPAAFIVHQGIHPCGVPAQSLLHPVHTVQQRGEVQRGNKPQGGEERGGGLFVRGAAVFFREGQYQRAPQGVRKQRQLLLRQRRRPLYSLQKFCAALRRHLALPAAGKGFAQNENIGLLAAQAQAPCAAHGCGGADALPAGKIPVVQQPFSGGARLVTSEPGAGALQLAQGSPYFPGGEGAAAAAVDICQGRRGLSAGGQSAGADI